MKSRTSSSKRTLLRKDIFRFAPLWGIYLTGGLLVMLSTLNNVRGQHNAELLTQTMGPFSILNMIYAGLAALMLFGDLYNTRLCFALHSLPMRRETWFLTHVISGFLYSFVPHLVATLLFLPLLGEYWFLAWAWLLSMTLQYLFFFGLAVLAALLCGNRFATVAVYSIFNFLSLIAYWFAQTLYVPRLQGVVLSQKPFIQCSPVVQMTINNNLVQFNSQWIEGRERIVTYQGFGEGWGYLAICAGVGIALLGVALLVYRKRKLEFAGDFLATKPLAPLFSVVFALCVACGFALFGTFFFVGTFWIYFAVGLILGWFSGQMLLQRTVKVFQGKAFLKLGALILVLALSLGLTVLDPLGVNTYVPEADQVERVEFGRGHISQYTAIVNGVNSTDPEKIQAICDIHEQILRQEEGDWDQRIGYAVRYTLKSGRQVVRNYIVYRDQEAWSMINALSLGLEDVLGTTDQKAWMKSVDSVTFNYSDIQDILLKTWNATGKYPAPVAEVKRDLLEAIWQDCADGNVGIELEPVGKGYYQHTVSVSWYNGTEYRYRTLGITDRMEHCQAWLEKYADIVKYSG